MGLSSTSISKTLQHVSHQILVLDCRSNVNTTMLIVCSRKKSSSSERWKCIKDITVFFNYEVLYMCNCVQGILTMRDTYSITIDTKNYPQVIAITQYYHRGLGQCNKPWLFSSKLKYNHKDCSNENRHISHELVLHAVFL